MSELDYCPNCVGGDDYMDWYCSDFTPDNELCTSCECHEDDIIDNEDDEE